MKHKKDTSNIKTVNKPSKSPVQADEAQKIAKDAKPASADCHQDIVKRLMTHSQYFPSNPSNKALTVTYGNQTLPAYHTPNVATQHYPTYNHQMYENNQQFADYTHRDFYYQQEQQNYNQFANINTHPSCPSPTLSSPSTHNTFDQISNGSPRNDYIFNGDFTLNFNADFDGFPLITVAKAEQFPDTQAPLPMKSFEIGQLTPVKTESQASDEIKNSFVDVTLM